MKKGIAVLLPLVLAGAAGCGIFYQFVYKNNSLQGSGRISSQSEDAVYVDSVRMLAGLDSGSGKVQRFAGIVEPQKTWSAKLEGEKTVKETFVKEGDEVKIGDKLFTYDTTDDEDKLTKDEIEQERSKNEIETAKQRITQLESEKAKASAEDQLTYTTNILSEENTVKTEEYEMKVRELEIEQMKEAIAHADVLSELEGVVQTVARLTDNSNGGSSLADATSDAYITVMEVGDYRIRGTVNEQNINSVYQGQPMIAFSRVDDRYWNGEVTEIRTDNGQTNQNENAMFDSGGSDNSSSSTNYTFYVSLDSSEDLLLGQHVYLEPDEGQTQKRDGIWLPGYYFIAEGADKMTGEDGAAGDAAGPAETEMNDLQEMPEEFEDESEEDGIFEEYNDYNPENMISQSFGPAAGVTYQVWAASDKDRLEKRTVTIGGYDETLDLWEVTSGLTADDYITVPNSFLEESLPVIYMDYSQDAAAGNGYGAPDLYDGGWSDDGFYDTGSLGDEYWEEESWDEEDWDDEDWDEEDEEEEDSEDWEEWIPLEEWTEDWTEEET